MGHATCGRRSGCPWPARPCTSVWRMPGSIAERRVAVDVECRACRDAVRPVQRLLDTARGPSIPHPVVGDPDEVGELWDAAWGGIDEQVATWPLARVLAELPLRDDLAAALDRHVVECDPSLATADDVVRGALVRSLVDEYLNRWVQAHS